MENKVNEAYLLLGTNLGNRAGNLARARKAIEERMGPLQKQSSVYETEPWGISGQQAFYNQTLVVFTPLGALELLTIIHQVEQEMGRVRKERYGARVIDIDILFFNQEVYNTPALTIPHPRITERNFVLVPLAEMAPGFIHPVLKLPIGALLKQSTDQLLVKRLDEAKISG